MVSSQTTNLVLMVESLCSPSSRLLVVALNGFSASMALTAGLAWALPHWLVPVMVGYGEKGGSDVGYVSLAGDFPISSCLSDVFFSLL